MCFISTFFGNFEDSQEFFSTFYDFCKIQRITCFPGDTLRMIRNFATPDPSAAGIRVVLIKIVRV